MDLNFLYDKPLLIFNTITINSILATVVMLYNLETVTNALFMAKGFYENFGIPLKTNRVTVTNGTKTVKFPHTARSHSNHIKVTTRLQVHIPHFRFHQIRWLALTPTFVRLYAIILLGVLILHTLNWLSN